MSKRNKEILTHAVLVLMIVGGAWQFFANLDWVLAPGRRAAMQEATAQVEARWEKKKGGGKGTSYTWHILELAGIGDCPCKGQARVDAYLYNKTAIGDSMEVLCHKAVCYHRADIRWDFGFRIQIILAGIGALVCAVIEGVLLYRMHKRKLNQPR
ncbi:MAG: hypothetical protein QMD09_07995 [Desulfatibacillaceae bacterium]|nr:hypothetical protein [Desulfatibacillaceae bacterium]